MYIIGLLENNEIDIAPADLTVTKARSAVVDYLPGITPDNQQIFIRNPAEALNWKAYVEPFTLGSWIGILLFIVIIPIVVAAILVFGNIQITTYSFINCKLKENCSIY